MVKKREPEVTRKALLEAAETVFLEKGFGNTALSEIARYTIYYGESAGRYPNSLQINDVSSTSSTIPDLPFGTYFFVVTTRDTLDGESEFSEMVTAAVN